MSRTFSRLLVLSLLAAAPAAGAAQQTDAAPPSLARVRSQLTALAHDSMLGRRTGTIGAQRAARYIAGVMREIGLTPGGDAGYMQRIPMRLSVTAQGTLRATALRSFAAYDSLPAADRVLDANVVGLIPGADPVLRNEAVIVGAHYDHIGIRPAVNGDSIANGADDDASGVIAVLEIARALRQGPAPRRTVIFVAFTGEESGGVGSAWYMAQPAVPLERTVAQFQIEMIARPDSLVGGSGRAWLTGYELSTMGPLLAAAGVPVVRDPRPDQNFFRRSDNYRFAQRGIPAHTFSSFNLHADYHRVSDEVDRVDFTHMTSLIEAATRAVRVLADGPRPEWNPGMRPGG
ncbi:MAG TPA: M20/M25/M40 family metallo-hydrolase [Longimicrobiales bacterium]|nr:M20/M25/M40 family metallo-hydrolase [Longimicrobiales bacterium]